MACGLAHLHIAVDGGDKHDGVVHVRLDLDPLKVVDRRCARRLQTDDEDEAGDELERRDERRRGNQVDAQLVDEEQRARGGREGQHGHDRLTRVRLLRAAAHVYPCVAADDTPSRRPAGFEGKQFTDEFTESVESRIRPNWGFGETPGKLLTL